MGQNQSGTFMGFPRRHRRPGVRNLALAFPLSSGLSHLVARAAGGTGVTAVSVHDALDTELSDFSRQIVTSFLANPNVGEVLLISSGGTNDPAESIAEQMRAAGVPTECFPLREARSVDAFLQALRESCQEAVNRCDAVERTPVALAELLIGAECGGSDGYSGLSANPVVGRVVDTLVAAGGSALLCELPEAIGAEHLLAARAVDATTAARVTDAVLAWETLASRFGADLRGAQPSPGNQEGGLTTIEEKSLGAIAKGGKSPVAEYVCYGEAPSRPGLVVMDTPGHDIEQLTGMAAAGAQLVLFTTGRGTPTGSPVAPTLKIATNTAMARQLSSLIDYDASPVLDGKPLDTAGEELFELTLATANGRLTLAEVAGQRDFALPPLSASSARIEALP